MHNGKKTAARLLCCFGPRALARRARVRDGAPAFTLAFRESAGSFLISVTLHTKGNPACTMGTHSNIARQHVSTTLQACNWHFLPRFKNHASVSHSSPRKGRQPLVWGVLFGSSVHAHVVYIFTGLCCFCFPLPSRLHFQVSGNLHFRTADRNLCRGPFLVFALRATKRRRGYRRDNRERCNT